MARGRSRDEKLFNPDGRRHFRKTYSLVEVRYSLIVLAVLVVLVGWVIWRGTQVDPSLFNFDVQLLDKPTGPTPVEHRAGPKLGMTRPGGKAGATASKVDHPFPTDLAAAGFTMGRVKRFAPDDMYQKINGRAGFYRSFGAKALYAFTLTATGNASRAVDIEAFDLATVDNALGAYGKERQADAKPSLVSGGLGHISRNALFLVRGRFYVRAIGSDESAEVIAQLEHLRATLDKGLASASLPWAYGLFVGGLGVDPGKVGYEPENAFSLSFAKRVYSVEMDEDGTAAFVIATADKTAAVGLVKQFEKAFTQQGETAGKKAGVSWARDQFQKRVSGAKESAGFVIGVYSARDVAAATRLLERLEKALGGLDQAARAAARATKPTGGTKAPKSPEGEYSEGQ